MGLKAENTSREGAEQCSKVKRLQKDEVGGGRGEGEPEEWSTGKGKAGREYI